MNFKQFLLASLVILVFLPGRNTAEESNIQAEPFRFTFDSIPFGKSMEEVLHMVQGTKIEARESKIEMSINLCTGLKDHFIEGLYTTRLGGLIGGSYFNTETVKRYLIRYEDGLKTDLFFVSDYDKENYTLFLVVKHPDGQPFGFETVFKDMEKQITEKANIVPEIERTKYYHYTSRNPRWIPALLGVWALQNQEVFLLTIESGIYDCYPAVLYRSSAGWLKYLTSCRQANAAERVKHAEKHDL